jgi:hypothetical protein
MFYKSIPFTEVDDSIPCVEIAQVESSLLLADYEHKQTIISFISENGTIDTIEKALALDELIENQSNDYRLISTPLIKKLSLY